MGKMLVEEAQGETDGVNRAFATSVGYVAGSLSVFLNGILLQQLGDDGWEELGGTLFEMNSPPKEDDALKVAYRI